MRYGWMVRIRWGLAFSAVVSTLWGCARLEPPERSVREDPFDEVQIARFEYADPATRSIVALPPRAYRAKWWFQAGLARPRTQQGFSRLDPILDSALRKVPDSTHVRVMVTFRDTVTMPLFPRLRDDLPRNAPQNLELLDSAAAVIQEIQKRRDVRYAVDTVTLKTSFHARILDRFWVAQTCWISLRADTVPLLLTRSEIEFVGPDTGRAAPDHDNNPANDVIEARGRINSDPYLSLPVPDGRMAILDTGVLTSHLLLCTPSRLCMVADCVNNVGIAGVLSSQCSPIPPMSTCPPSAGGDTYRDGHGTATAAILVGNAAKGSRFQGVTRASLDSYQVYDAAGFVSIPAAMQGLQLAMARLDPLIVFEMQSNTQPLIADLSAAADHAFGCGFAVIAANGNEKANGVGVPAACRRAIGVGAFQLTMNMPVEDMARGPTTDGRIKPDLLAPSYTETAANDLTRNDKMAEHTGTSGATPYAAGAACLIRNWLTASWPPPDPGKVYAMLILAGPEDGPFPPDDRDGVGLFHLPPSGESRCGKVWMTPATSSVSIYIYAPASGAKHLSAAIWWPEQAIAAGGVPVDTHNDLNLEILSPGFLGIPFLRAKSDGVGGVFERTHVDGKVAGLWEIRIRPKTMRTRSQVVYWASAVGP